MAKKNDILYLGDDGMAAMERSILSEILGREDADALIADANEDDSELDADLQEIVDSAPPLDEIFK